MTIKSKAFLGPLAHILFWMLLVYILYVFRRNEQSPSGFTVMQPVKGLSFLPMIGLFYIHSYILVPRFLMQKKKFLHFLLTLVLISLTAMLSVFILYGYVQYINPLTGLLPPGGFSFARLMAPRIAACIFFVGASTGYGVIRENEKIEKRRKEKENENLRTELTFLRSQVNPHFMLNVLNSMVALARKGSQQLEPVLIELASLMSYMLYELDNEKVSLEEEIEYLRSYISLQMVRFGNDVKVSFDVHQVNTGHLIEPMLLIPLVENAFKHGIGLFEDAEIEVLIRVPEDNRLHLSVRNKFNDDMEIEKDKNSGIGLSNLKKRLSLIYPDRFELYTMKDDNWFTAQLNLQLS